MKKALPILVLAGLCAAPVAAAPPSLTLKAAPTVVSWGGTSTLSGALSTQKTGQSIDIQTQECGQNGFKKTASATTTSGGAYTYAAKPTINTTYQAKLKGSTSPSVMVKVAPLVQLKVAGGAVFRKFNATVTAAQAFNGKYVVFQRRNRLKHKWTTIKKVTLATQSGKAPTIVTSKSFTVRTIGHPLTRLILPAAQAGTCYLPATSKSIKS